MTFIGGQIGRRTLMSGPASLMLVTAARAQQAPSPMEIAAIAKEAWIYAYPMLMNYNTMWHQAVNQPSLEYVGGFNKFRHYARYFTPANHDVVTPNNDTPYSWAWLDLRAEPVVLSVPAVPPDRYYVNQFFDLFTYNFTILGTRTTGRDASDFLFAGPGWNGAVPPGIKRVLRPETEIVGTLTRTALHGADDIPVLQAIQAGYRLRPLSAYTGAAPPPPAPSVDWLPWDEKAALGPNFIAYLNLLLRFYPVIHPSETDLFQRFARIGIGAGRAFQIAALSEANRQALANGVAEGQAALRRQIAATRSSIGLFGTREELGAGYLKRAVAAAMGLYGLSKQEAIYIGTDRDGAGKPLDGDQHYTLRFAKGALPPASIFWSATVYGLPDRFLVDNPINRYSLGDRSGLKTAADGSTTIYLRATRPNGDRDANWLPTPKSGPFNVIVRIYGPSAAVQSGAWTMPHVQKEG